MNRNGFSLVQVMVVAGIMGGLSLVMMKTIDNLNSGTRQMNTFEEELEFKRQVNQLISDPDICRISLAGEGPPGSPINPISFSKVNANEINENKGVDVELFTPDEELRKRRTKIFSAIDLEKNKYKSLTINSMKLYFLNEPYVDYIPSTLHKDIAQLVIKYTKRVDANNLRPKIFKTNVLLNLKTDIESETTILTCGPRYDFRPLAKFNLIKEDKVEVSAFFGKEAKCPDGMIANAACTSTNVSNCSGSASKLECHKPLGDIKRDMTTKLIKIGAYGRMNTCPPFHTISGFCSGKDPNSYCKLYNNTVKALFFIRCSPLKIEEHVKGSFETYEEFYTESRFETLVCPDESYLTGVCSSGISKKLCRNNYKGIRCSRIIN